MNISETLLKTLNHLLIPIISLVLSLVLYFVFINPYNSYSASFDAMMNSYEKSNQELENNLKVLNQASEKKEKLEKFNSNLRSLVPDSANPSDVVGMIDKNANNLKFRTIDENRSISSQENDKKRLIEVRFNGRSPGIATSINFLKSLTTDRGKLIKITKVELTNIPEELFTRVSFNAYSIFAPPAVNVAVETPIQNVFADEKFVKLLDSF
jgi:hypothetical protein